jgi:hypothetical protein
METLQVSLNETQPQRKTSGCRGYEEPQTDLKASFPAAKFLVANTYYNIINVLFYLSRIYYSNIDTVYT